MCNHPQQVSQQQQEQQQKPKEQPQQRSEAAATSAQPQPTSPTSAYALFMHREEIRRNKRQAARVAATKIQLTGELIAKTKKNITRCSFEDLEILARETLFRKHLQRQLHHRRMLLQAYMLARRQGRIAKVPTPQATEKRAPMGKKR